ncbi:uroporphyrinogen-III C-methyltransferase [Gulbenkiania mobilis]|uniref:uroporphyrinogen-III C-methyltransferase n=1 Tax=Gulbenkiania mobilis TaxID=397457 RepID=UPI0009F94C73|nr:uroporphyrinogen-III C-methyltransferase [Gulbenkiania mobilis]
MNEPCDSRYLLPAASANPVRGHVSLVGAGPGDPELLTLRALQRLQTADVVLYDHLVSPAIRALIPARTERICVGKRASRHTLPQEAINALIVSHARAGRRVVRLKGGDPFLFGRGGEEMEEVVAAGFDYEVVPGITAATGAAASTGIPLTHRDHAQGCLFVTGHRRQGEDRLAWTRHTGPEETLVVYMGLNEAPRIAADLIDAGRAPDTPVATVENATTPRERVVLATLATLAATLEQEAVASPALLIIGSVVRLYRPAHRAAAEEVFAGA